MDQIELQLNPIQTAIAKVAGSYHIMESQQEQLAELHQAYEMTSNQNALLQRAMDDLNYLNLFDLHNVKEIIPIADRKEYYQRLRRMRQENPLAKQAVKLILRFTLGNGVQISIGPDPDKPTPTAADVDVENDPEGDKLNGLFPGPRVNNSRQGAGLKPLPRARPQVSEAVELDDSDQLAEIVKSIWSDDENQLALTSHEAMKEWMDNVVVDGEKYFVGTVAKAEPYLKITEIPVEEITDIIYHPDNRNIPLYYLRTWQPLKFSEDAGYAPDGSVKKRFYLDYRITDDQLAEAKKGGRIKIKAANLAPTEERIFPTLINPLWTRKGKRGVSELYASREWFRVYKEFMEDRAAINAAATAVAHKRKIKAGPTGVAQFTGRFGGLPVGYNNPENEGNILATLTRPSPAATYDSNPAVDLEWMKTDTGAANAKEDGRSLLAAGAAGIGMFLHYMGEGGDSNLATAQAMELPMVKTFEDWQEWVNSVIIEFLRWGIEVATDRENSKKQIERISGQFPPLISQDVVKYTTAWSQIVQNIAPGNRVAQSEAIRGSLTTMRVPNVDAIMARIEQEQIRVELERQQREQEMRDAMANADPFGGNGNGNGNGNGKGARDGSGQLDPQLKAIAKGKPPPERNGPKPPR